MSDELHLLQDQPTDIPEIALHNFAAWIELQPIQTLAGLLELISNDLYRRGEWSAGNDVKDVTRELRGL